MLLKSKPENKGSYAIKLTFLKTKLFIFEKEKLYLYLITELKSDDSKDNATINK